MKIAFIYHLNATDVRTWSGTPYYMIHNLRLSGHEVIIIKNNTFFKYLYIPIKILYKIFGKYYDEMRSPLLLKLMCVGLNKKIVINKCNCIISLSSLSVAYLKTDVPIILWLDACFHDLINFYDGNWSTLCKKTIANGNLVEKNSLENASKIVFSSEWARNSAITKFGNLESKISFINFGLNLETIKDDTFITNSIKERINNNKITFLFNGVDWDRKNGSYVVNFVTEMYKKGYDVKLNIIGNVPNYIDIIPGLIINYGFLDKINDKELFNMIYSESNFLFVPSKAECAGMVFAEAAYFGLPVITNNIGGISSIVINNVTGIFIDDYSLLSMNKNIERVANLFYDRRSYEKMCKSGRDKYFLDLQWSKNIIKLLNYKNESLLVE